MRQLSLGIVVLVAFFIGCVTSTIFSPLFVEPADAQPRDAEDKWEYQCIATTQTKPRRHGDADRSPNFVKTINELGQQGWELVAMDISRGPTTRFCFKRAL